MTVEAKREPFGIAGISLALLLAVTVSGCSSTMGGGYGRASLPQQSNALLEDSTSAGQPAAAAMSAAVSQAPGYRNLNVPEGDPASRLLTEEERIAAILELEELARRQAEGMTKPM